VNKAKKLETTFSLIMRASTVVNFALVRRRFKPSDLQEARNCLKEAMFEIDELIADA